MIVECEKCQAKFQLDELQVPEQGRKVRCSKCKHIFLVQKPTPLEEEDLDFEFDEGVFDSMTGEGPPPPPPPSQAMPETFEPTVKIDLAEQEEGLDYGGEEQEEEIAPTRPPPRKRGLTKPLVVVAALIVLIGLAAAVLGVMGKLPFLPGPPEEPTAYLTIDPASLEGKWEKNVQVPRIFIVKGTVQNGSKRPKAYVKIQALLLDRSGKTLQETWAYCGNPIPTRDLQTKTPAEIQKLMRNRNGLKGMNQSIPPGASIPFAVVFFDVPKEVESFGAEVMEALIPGPA